MGLPKKLNTIEEKVNDNKKITVQDELTLIFVTLSVKDSSKEKMLKRVCGVLKKIDYIVEYRRVVIDSIISFQIENFVKTKEDKDNLNEVVSMQMSVEELFVQTEREYEFDSGYNQGIKEGVKKGKIEAEDEIILNMLKNSIEDELIMKYTNCSREHLQELKKSIQ
jgi:predicted transposase/invertase (TIGR01784 family)